MTPQAFAILDECRALGIELVAQGDRLRFWPASAMTADLAEKLATHKPAVLAALAEARLLSAIGFDPSRFQLVPVAEFDTACRKLRDAGLSNP